MQSSTAMPGMSSGEERFVLRPGQLTLQSYLEMLQIGMRLVVTWPPGYGKSIGFAMAWKAGFEKGIVNRLLFVVANDTQRRQIINDFVAECECVGAPHDGGVWAFDRSASDIKQAGTGGSLIFVCTVQQLQASIGGPGLNTLKYLLLMAGTKWMVAFDEFHHYGEDMAWGKSAQVAMEYAAVIMAMSATPYRRGADIIFPEPALTVTYSQAVQEKAVKVMVCHTYDYRVTVTEDDREIEYTTSQIMDAAPDGIDRWEERRNIRYSPEYIHPLILHPLTRLMHKRQETGKKLQMLVRAMSCLHAQMVCSQIKTFTDGGLSVDWIGTGPHGREGRINDDLREAFCPTKGEDGQRPPARLDILVQVSMAGEGFDSVTVAEIVDLFPVSKRALNGVATSDKQFYGRGSRIIRGAEDVVLHVSIPTDHPLAKWAGAKLHAWMDASGTEVDPNDEDRVATPPEIDLFDVPEFPRKRAIELLNITTENEHFRRFAEAAGRRAKYDIDEDKEELFELYRQVFYRHADEQSEKARYLQARESVDAIVGRIALILAKRSPLSNGQVSGSLIGHFKHEISRKMVRHFSMSRDAMLLPDLEQAYAWCKAYLAQLK